MNTSMINAMVSLNQLQRKLDIHAHNVANMDTVGFKRQDATFQDILTSHYRQEPEQQLPGRLTPLGLNVGWGTRVATQHIDFSQGVLKQTDHPLDLAIEGNALFQIDLIRLDENGDAVLDENGEVIFDRLWTRNGAFQLTVQPGDDENVYLATADGHLLRGMENELIRIPRNRDFTVDAYGRIFVTSGVEGEPPIQIAQLKLVRVLRPQLLENLGDNLYTLPNDIEDADLVLQPLDEFNREGIAVRQGYLEQSNVNMADELVELMKVQRAYQLNARAIMSSDTMMSLANQLRS